MIVLLSSLPSYDYFHMTGMQMPPRLPSFAEVIIAEYSKRSAPPAHCVSPVTPSLPSASSK
eukprot:212671-Pelagomonas_calceolata.AAC.1